MIDLIPGRRMGALFGALPAALLALVLWPSMVMADAQKSELVFLRSDGCRIVGPSGDAITLKGCNLGNWLMLEPWMFGGCLEAKDQAQIFATLRSRFGDERAARLIDLYRQAYVSPRDFQLIKSFGFNVVRLPFDYRLVQEDEPPYAIRPHAFRWLDRALEMAQAAGVYVVLDLHGAPGGQSNQMHTGQADCNELWSSEEDRKRTAMVWQAVASRYRDRAVVAAYDLLNEPYGDYHTDLSQDLVRLMDQLYSAVRAVDDRHLVFLPGGLGIGIEFYGNPQERGWHDVGFTEHYYPGLFGDAVAVESHARALNQSFPARAAYMRQMAMPYYVGEFNVVLNATGGAPMMREYYDRMAALGWPATMWSYKLLKPDAGAASGDCWYMVSNGQPLPMLSLASSSYEDFERFFTKLSTVDLAVNEGLRTALTQPQHAAFPLTEYPPVLMTVPQTARGRVPGWNAVDIGNAAPGGISQDVDGTVMIYAGGSDIYDRRDSFRFATREGNSGGQIIAQVVALSNTSPFAKAGVMARWGDEAGAAFAMTNVFPDGTVSLCSRSSAGGVARETKLEAGAFVPVELRLTVSGGTATGYYRTEPGPWQLVGTTAVPASSDYRDGLAVTAHTDIGLTAAKFRVGTSADVLPAPSATNAADELLQNGSFQAAGDTRDQPAQWSHWGDWLIQQNAPATNLRRALIADRQGGSGLWQDVPVKPGRRYTFSVDASRGAVPGCKIELRLEATMDGHQVALNTINYDSARLLARGARRLSVSATAATPSLRVLLIVTPQSDSAGGDAGVEFDKASLVQDGAIRPPP